MFSNPCGKTGFVQLACGKRKYGQRHFRLRSLQTIAVQLQKHAAGKQRRTLVAIDEGMVSRNAETVGGGKLGEIRFAVTGEIKLKFGTDEADLLR